MAHPLVEGFRLSPTQQQLWLRQGEQVGPYRVRAIVSVSGAVSGAIEPRPDEPPRVGSPRVEPPPIEPRRVEAALRAVMERHEMLRTTYRAVSGMTVPMQVIQPEWRWSLEHEDLGPVDDDAWEAAIEARFDALGDWVVALDRGPVWRAQLLTRSATEAVLLLSWPSLAADLSSLAIVVDEVARFEDERLPAADAADDDLPLQHVDVAEWQHELLEADGTAAGREFWQRLDLDALTSCRLPLRRSTRAPLDAFTPRSIGSALPADVMAGVSRWADAHDRTIEEVLLASWQLLMWRLTERTALSLGVGSEGRALPDLERVIGPLAKTLPVRLEVDPGWTFAELVEHSCVALQEHARWHALFAGPASGARTDADAAVPSCPLAFDAARWSPVRSAAGTTWTVVRADACLDRAELRLSLAGVEGDWQARWVYDERIHTAADATCIADQYVSVLRRVAAPTPPRLADFDVRGEWEQLHARSICVDYSARPDAARLDACVHELFEAHAAATPHRVAAIGEDERVSYGELNARADWLARFLRQQGVGPETRVGLFFEHSCDLLTAVLGILKAGAAFVPLPPGQPLARLASLADRAGAPIVLTHRHLADEWPSSSASRVVRIDADGWIERDGGAIAGRAIADPAIAGPAIAGLAAAVSGRAVEPDHLAYVMFTSGSTGLPKGVMVSHRALASYVTWAIAAYLPDADVSVPLHSSIGFDATLTSLFVPLCAGARVIVVRDTQSPDAIARAASSQSNEAGAVPANAAAATALDADAGAVRFGLLKITPAHLAWLAGTMTADRLPALGPTLVIGGEALAAEQLAAWQLHAPSTRIVNEYGPTEAAVGCVVHDTTASLLEPGPVPIGHPVADVDCHVVDEYGRQAPVGVTGELYVGGAQLARGYDGRPDLTAERFVPDPWAREAGARCYRTGDLVRRRSDGALTYVGRRDQQVKLRGHRVELGEVEAAVRQQVGIRDAVVVLREDVPGEARLVAYVVPTPAVPVASDRLQQLLRATLPDYMVPAVIVPLDTLPMTINGKVDRRRLPAPAGERPTLAQTYVAPRTAAEALLVRIWTEVLRLDRIGIRDNFFALGGDSILSLQIVARAAQAGLRLAPRLVFEHQTIEALAAVASEASAPAAEQGVVTGDAPLTPIQHWFFEQPLDDRHHFNQAVALELRSNAQQTAAEVRTQSAPSLEVTQAVEPARLDAAWRRVQRHHDALRLRFRRTTEGWVQTHTDADRIGPATWVDATGVAEAHREALWARVARASQTSLDLEQGPIAHMTLVHWGSDAPSRLLIVLHHVVADGVSWRVLLEDLQTLCGHAASASGLVELPPKTTSWKTWAEQLRTHVVSGALDTELPFWTSMSGGGARLPRDRAIVSAIASTTTSVNANVSSSTSVPDIDRVGSVASQRMVAVSLSVEETDELLHRLPSTLDVHVQDALLTGLVSALAEWTGEPSWRIDLEGHGRESLGGDEDVSRTVGWFTSLYPVSLTIPAGSAHVGDRADSGDRPDPVGALRDVRAALRRVPRHGFGYGPLRYLRDREIVRDLHDVEPPEISFNYWGQLDQVFSSSAAIGPSQAPVGPSRGRRQPRSHVFEISASVTEARLQVWWIYSADLHETETIERLAAALRETVRRISALPDAARVSLKTPVDFPLAEVTQTELDGIVATGGPVADIYPLSPMQEGMLFHRLYETEGAIYSQQFAARLNGPLDPAAFRQAWDDVVARHEVLRTGFFWERRERPLQVVREQAALPWTEEDWRGQPPEEQDARLAARLQADLARGVAVEQPPLMRVGLTRLQDDQWHVLWTSHHIVLDGWSMPIVARDVLLAYAARREGRTPWTGTPGARYADYIAWVRQQDAARAETFWRQTLDGFQTPSLLASTVDHVSPQATQAPMPSRQFLRAHLPPALVEALQQLGTARHVTMNTWCAGAWALLLAHCTRRRDVVFGTVVSGRPADLPGVETIPGLFINTLPLRLQVVPGMPALGWFAECQQRQLEARDYDYASLARVQGWSPLPAGTPLFDTLFVYENYPVEHAWREQSELRLDQASASALSSYPLTIEVAGARSELVVTVAFDPRRISAALAAFVRDSFAVVLSRVAAAPEGTLDALLDGLDRLALGTDADEARDLAAARQRSLRMLKRGVRT